MKIREVIRPVYFVGAKHYFSLLGACRHRARIKIMARLGEYFRQKGEEEHAAAATNLRNAFLTYEEYERENHPSKARYKLMRERLARTICHAMKTHLTKGSED